MTETKNEQIRQMYKQGLSVKEIAQQLGCSYQRVYQVVKKMNGQDVEQEQEIQTEAETEQEPEIVKCSICNTDTENWVVKNDVYICPLCLKDLAKALVENWDNFDRVDCIICECEYDGVTVDNTSICTDCLTRVLHIWFRPEEEEVEE